MSWLPGKSFQPSLMFAGKTRAYLSGAPLYGKPLPLPTNINIGWKGLPGTKALAHYVNLYINAIKRFLGSAPVFLTPIKDFNIPDVFSNWREMLA